MTYYTAGVPRGAPLSPRDFGAVGDGSVDDTAAVQACVDAAKALNCTIFVHPGVYKLTDRCCEGRRE